MKTVMVIVYYSGMNDLKIAIESVPSGSCDLIVVDASPTSEVEQLCGQFAFVTWLDGSRNGGYAWGMNLGVNYAVKRFAGEIDVIVLSNPDVRYTESSFLELIATAHSTDGVCYPLQVSENGDVMNHSVLPALGRFEMITGWLLPFINSKSAKEARRTIESAIATSGIVGMSPYTSGSGACIVLSYRAWELIGRMEDRCFLFSEDRMLTATAHRESITVSLCGSARIVHEGGFKGRGVSLLQLSEYLVSQRVAWSTLWPSSLTLLKLAQLGGLLLRALRSLWKGNVKNSLLYFSLVRLAAWNKLDISKLTGPDGVRIRVLDRYPRITQ